jgi:hypothetical protein
MPERAAGERCAGRARGAVGAALATLVRDNFTPENLRPNRRLSWVFSTV